MAEETFIRDSLSTLLGARLRNAPSRDELPDVVAAWKRTMQDIPGNTLVQAANDIVLTAEFWPTIKQVREAAYQVKVHNNTSAALNHFAPLVERSTVWLPSGCEKVQFSRETPARIAEIEAKYYSEGLPTDEELAEIDALTRPVIAQYLPPVLVEVEECIPF